MHRPKHHDLHSNGSPEPRGVELNNGDSGAFRPFRRVYSGDARDLSRLSLGKHGAKNISIPDSSVDLIVTSPPYWKKRNYGITNQIGQEASAEDYVAQIMVAMNAWRRVLRPSASIFLNVGDTYWKKSLQGIPSMIEAEARKQNWIVRNRIIWVKKGGMPEPVKDRLASRHEYVLHFAVNGYYYDLFGYAQEYSAAKRGANPGDVWEITPQRNLGEHLAPFPTEIVKRAIMLACPKLVCTLCGKPQKRIVQRSAMDVDLGRPQARRALEIAKERNLTEAHIAAIQATGISDAGKARRVQTGTDKNAKNVQELALYAKKVLGGYFREFTFTKKKDAGWQSCVCGAPFHPGVVLDPFMGTGTTLDVAGEMERSAIGVDLDISNKPESSV